VYLQSRLAGWLHIIIVVGSVHGLAAQQYCMSGSVTKTSNSPFKAGDPVAVTATVNAGTQSCTSDPASFITSCNARIDLKVQSGGRHWTSGSFSTGENAQVAITSVENNTTVVLNGMVDLTPQISSATTDDAFRVQRVQISSSLSGNLLENGSLPASFPASGFLSTAGVFLVTGGSADVAFTGQDCATDPRAKTFDIFIGGFLDKWDSQIVYRYYTEFGRKYRDTTVFRSDYFSHDGLRGDTKDGGQHLESYIRQLPDNAVINLIGHSYGGDTATQVAGSGGRAINVLITIDPVGGRRVLDVPKSDRRRNPPNPSWPRNLPAKFSAAKANVKTWIDVDARPHSVNFSDDLAVWGGKWDTLPDAPHKYDDIFIPAVGLHHADFDRLMDVPGHRGSALDWLLNH
jgi:hypothetical protein